MRRHGFPAIVAACAVAFGGWLLNQNHPLDASEEQNSSFRNAFGSQTKRAEPVESEDGIRLNYFEANWDRVLRNVAEQADMTLVMDRVPHGRYARRDRNRYELASAIRVLNSELEPQGFRLLQQGNFLIVLKLDHARTRYARPMLSEWKNDQPAGGQQQTGQPKQPHRPNPFSQVSSRKDDGPRVSWASQEEPKQQPPAPFSQQVKPAADEVPTPSTADEGPASVRAIPVKNAKAADIARSIYLVFEKRADLLREGLNGLPTVMVRPSPEAEATDALFQIGIDQSNNQLLVEATRTRGTHLARLIAEMDKPKGAAEETVKVIPNDGVTEVTAKDLNTQIHRMVTMRKQADEQSTDGDTTSPEGSLNLRGEVNVQAMQDLGILILKGNEADVAKVEAIIKQLETMSVGSLPDIHLRSLAYVNSEALAEMLSAVYEQLSELRQRSTTNETRSSVAFIPVVQPNAVLILAPAIELDSILKLTDELDKRTDPKSEFRVFSLRNSVASQVAASIGTFFEERGGLGTRVRVVADVRTNAVIVQGRPNDIEEVALLIEKMDHDEPASVHRVEVVELKHATAEELAETITTAIQAVLNPPTSTTGGFGGNQGSQELRDSRSVALEFLAANGTSRELVRSGILVDVRVSADARSNSLLVSAPEASMPLMTALIRQLDKAPAAVAEIKVFALRNADAAQSVELLTAMFENQNQEDQLGVQIAGAADTSSSLIPVQFTADLRTNTVLAVGSADALSVVEAILLRLDTAESRQRQTTVISLRNVQASVVAESLTSFLEQQQELQDSSEDLISNIERLRQEVIISPDDTSNSLIVSASPEYFSEITQIITELDSNPAQVIIQALLVEVQLDNTDEFGVELGFQDPLLFSRGLIDTVETVTTSGIDPATGFQQQIQTVISANGNPGFNFNNTVNSLGNNVAGLIPGQTGIPTSPSRVASQGISNFSLGRQNGDLGFGGFVFSAQSDAVNVLVRALAARRTVHVLSRPQIRTTHNTLARIQVGQQVPVVDGVTVTDNFVTPDITQQDVGIILQVTPRVTPDGTISMEVYAEKSALASGGVPVFTDVTTGNVVESVIVDTAIADTTVAVPNGQTIVIGGMITKSDETLERKVPWLGDLPLVGSLFRYDGTNTARTELLIFLTPRIIYSDVDSELIKQIESERLHFLESEAEEIHGPLFAVPPSGVDQMCPPMTDGIIGPPVPAESYPVPHEDSIVLPPQAKSESTDKNPFAGTEGVTLPTAEFETETNSTKVRPASMNSTEADIDLTSVVNADSSEPTETSPKPSVAKESTAPEKTSWFSRLRRR